MTCRDLSMMVALAGVVMLNGCQSISKRMVLPAPPGTNAAASRHNDEGIEAYQQQQWEVAKQHFGAAIEVSPEFAEAHYNIGETLYRLKAIPEGDAHFIQAANLAPGNKVIWNAPPLRGVTVSDKEVSGKSPDGHMHSH